MSEEHGSVKSVVEIVGSVVKPLYEDAVQPAAKQIGRTLETVTKSVNIALMPIKVLVWGYEQIEYWLTSRLADKLRNVPDERIVSPPPIIAGPIIEALRYAGYDEHLRELYANLLASAMDRDTVSQAHPGYVEILKNLCSDEALLLTVYIRESVHPAINIKGTTNDGKYVLYQRFFNHLDNTVALNTPALIPAYLDNLIRLGILEAPANTELSNQALYEPLEIDPAIEPYLAQIVDGGREVQFERLVIRLTVFGAQFVRQVVIDKA
jgi:hypothetical protein